MADQNQLKLRLRLAKAKAKAAAKYDVTDGLPVVTEEKNLLDPSTKTGAAARGVVQGGSLGFGDELMAAVDTVGEGIGRNLERVGLKDKPTVDVDPAVNPSSVKLKKSWDPKSGEQTTQEFLAEQDRVIPESVPEDTRPGLAETYRKLRDSYRADNKASEEAHPVIYGASELAGGLAVPVPGGGAAKGIGLGARALKGGANAAKLGAAIGLGKSEADLTEGEIGKAAGDTAINAAVSAPFGAGGEVVGAGFGRLASYFGGRGVNPVTHAADPLKDGVVRKMAGSQAVKAAGLDGGRIRNLVHKLGLEAEELPAKGNEMLDEGLIPVLGSKVKVAQRAQALVDKEGGKIDSALDLANASGVRPDFDTAASRAFGHLMSGNMPRAGSAARPAGHLSTAAEEAAGPAKKLVENIARETGDFHQMNQLKSDAYKFASFDPEAKMQPKLFRKTVKGLKESIEDQVGAAAGPAQREALITANHRYGLGALTRQLAEDTAGREATHKVLGWGSAMLGLTALGGGGGYAAGDGAGALTGAVVVPLVATLISRRGHAPAALALRAMSDAIEKGGPVLEKMFGRTGALIAAQQTPEQRQEMLMELTKDAEHQAEIVNGLEAEAAKSEPQKPKRLTDYFKGVQ